MRNLRILTAVKAITDATKTKHGQITIGCDNLLAGQHAIEWNHFPSPSNDHFDILQCIHLIRQDLHIKVRYYYVEAHQHKRYRYLGDKWAILNDKMDALAKSALEAASVPVDLPIHDKEWSIVLPSGKVCRRFKKTLRRYIEGTRLEAHWARSKKRKNYTKPPYITPQVLPLLDLSTCERAWQRLKGGMK